MVTQAWLIFTPEEIEAARELDGEPGTGEPRIGGRLIDNPLANNLGEGTLLGKTVVPARLLNDPDFSRWWDMCSTLPIRTMDSDVMFLPEEEN